MTTIKRKRRIASKSIQSKISFAQTMIGEFWISDENDGEQLFINVHQLDVEQLRTLLNGLGNLFSSISSALYDHRHITQKEKT